MSRQEKFKHKNSSLTSGLPSSPTLHCVPALCITQTSPISKNTCSTMKSNILLASSCCCRFVWLLSCVQLFCDSMDCSSPGSSVHGVSQARILEWFATSFSRGIFLTQGPNQCFLHWQVDSLPLRHQGNPSVYKTTP